MGFNIYQNTHSILKLYFLASLQEVNNHPFNIGSIYQSTDLKNLDKAVDCQIFFLKGGVGGTNRLESVSYLSSVSLWVSSDPASAERKTVFL